MSLAIRKVIEPAVYGYRKCEPQVPYNGSFINWFHYNMAEPSLFLRMVWSCEIVTLTMTLQHYTCTNALLKYIHWNRIETVRSLKYWVRLHEKTKCQYIYPLELMYNFMLYVSRVERLKCNVDISIKLFYYLLWHISIFPIYRGQVDYT